MNCLDWWIFGNGWGMRSPYFDDRFYWLVDTSRGREHGKGAFYRAGFGYGAQLSSIQWTHPKPGESRVLCGRPFRPFHSARKWGRVEVSWAMQGMPKGIDEMNDALRHLKRDLDSPTLEPTLWLNRVKTTPEAGHD